MNRLPLLACLTFAWAVTLQTHVQADNWPQWRGPARTDISTETKLLEKWPDAGPQRVWLFENAGVGYSGPAVVGDQLYILGGRDGKEQVICINVTTGKEVWSAELGEELDNDWGNGPRNSSRRRRLRLRFRRNQHGDLRQDQRRHRGVVEKTDRLRWLRTALGLHGVGVDRRRQADLHSRRRIGHDVGPEQEDRRNGLAIKRLERQCPLFVCHRGDSQRHSPIHSGDGEERRRYQCRKRLDRLANGMARQSGRDSDTHFSRRLCLCHVGL